jgi:hypothetical protein
LQNLNDKLKNSNELGEEQLKIKQEQINNLQAQLVQKKSIPVTLWLLVIIGVVIGILIGKGCN